MIASPYELAERFIGTQEVNGQLDNPQVMAWLTTDNTWPEHDEVPWCSGFVNWVCKIMRAPRSKSLMARSWLGVGRPIRLEEARAGWDVCIFSRGGENEPGPDVLDAPGHVAFFSALGDEKMVFVLGGNQGNKVSVSRYERRRLLGVRRVKEIR